MSASTHQPAQDPFQSSIEANQYADKFGTLSWEMSEAVASIFNSLPPEERRRRTHFLREIMLSASTVLTRAAVAPYSDIASVLNAQLQPLRDQANASLSRTMPDY